MDGSAREGTSKGAIELREILNNEENSQRRQNLRNIKGAAPPLALWIHDLACKANFADNVVGRRMPDKFQRRAHAHAECKRPLNPDWGRNVAPRKKLRATDAAACGQMRKHMNEYHRPQRMERSRYRTVWRNFCIFGDGNMSRTENAAPPIATRSVKRKTPGRRRLFPETDGIRVISRKTLALWPLNCPLRRIEPACFVGPPSFQSSYARTGSTGGGATSAHFRSVPSVLRGHFGHLERGRASPPPKSATARRHCVISPTVAPPVHQPVPVSGVPLLS